jgi:Uma2 family endonuclease
MIANSDSIATATSIANPLGWTIRDLDAMPDDGGWKRYEIIDGELSVTRAPHIRHQGAASKLNIVLGNWSLQTGLGTVFQTPGVIFTPIDAVIPDVVWISQERLANGVDDAGHLTIAPELMIEVLSPGEQNAQRDKEVKLKLYSRYGVQEYWIVDWRLQTLEIYRREGVQLQRVATLLVNDTLTSPLLPDFSVPLSIVFS